MKKLVKGIVDFRKNVLPGYRETFARLALGQAPDALFIACSDSRVVANLFASTDPGDLFVIRNVGNMIPCCGDDGHSTADESEAAAIEFALLKLNVSDIIVCGHSECGAMIALTGGRANVPAPNLREWLRHGEDALGQFRAGKALSKNLEPHNQLSQLNVLQQLEHLRTYPIVAERVKANQLSLHGWWFDIKNADVYEYEAGDKNFRLIDEEYAEKLIKRARR